MMKKTLKPREFYKALDESKQSARSCGCATLVICFLIILIVTEGTVFFVGRKLKSASPVSELTKPNINVSYNFSKMDSGESFELVIQEGVLCSKLAGVLKRDNISCRISSDGIFVSGKVNFAVPSNLTGQFTPEVKDGRLRFNLEKVTVGTLKAPDFLATGLSGALSNAVKSGYGELDSLSVESVYLQDGIMTVKAKKK